MRLNNTALLNSKARQAVEAAARMIQAQRPEHNQATLLAQRIRVSAWTERWLHDPKFRRQVLDKANIRAEVIG